MPADAADREFSQRFSTVANGDIELIGNTSMTCPTGGASCAAARAGTAAGTLNSNNGHAMTYIDLDSDAATFNSTRSTLDLPAGATVLFAGLYWGGESTAADTLRGAVKLDTPAAGGYTDLTASAINGATADPSQYHAFVDVTSLVSAGGDGVYTAANVNGTSTAANKYAGWSLVIAYSVSGGTRNHIKVYDGLQRVSTENPTEAVTISGFTTPATGTVSAKLGIVSYDGDRGSVGGSALLNATAVSDAQNPANNIFNSTISRNGSHFTAKDPNYANQLGYEADVFTVNGALANNSTSATLTMTTADGDYYLPGVVTLVNPPETVAPNTTIDSGPTGNTNDNTPTWTFSSSEAGSTFECRIDSGAWAACPTPYTPAALSDGNHTFEVRAVDPQLNVDATPASRTITVDATAPALVALTDSDPDSPANDNNPEIKGNAEAGSTVRLYMNATCTSAVAATGTAAAFTAPGLTVAVANDTTTTYWATATDSFGNASACSTSSLQYREDSTAPALVTLGDSDPDSPANDNNPEIKGTAEAGSTVRLYTNATCTSTVAASGTASAFTSPGLTVTVPADATTTFWATATDAAGNTSACSVSSLAYREDSTSPNTTIDSGPNGVTNDSTPTFAFSSSESPSTFECRVDGAPWATCSSPHTTANLSEGVHTFEVRAIDPAGNVDQTPASRTITVDTADPAPVVLGDSDPDSPANDNGPEIKGDAEAGSTVRLYTNATCTSAVAASGTAAAFTSPGLTVTVPGDATTTFWATATDAAGNVSACSTSSLAYREDSTGPNTTIDSGPSSPTNDSTPTFGFSSDETPSSFECRVDAGTWADCDSSHTTLDLPDGTHIFEVRATDAAGNPDSTPASASITVDTTAPETTIDSGPAGLIDESTPTYTFSSSEPGSIFECRVNGGAWESCSSPHTTASLADGPHTFEVRAIDEAGNADSTPDSRSITVDTTAPETTIYSGPSGLVGDPTPTYAFSSSESPSTFECRVDGGAWTPCSSPETTPSLSDGAHTFEVRAIDAAGNADATPEVREIVVDTTAPSTTLDSGPSGPTTDPTPTFAFSSDEVGSSYECSIDGGPWAPCASPETTASLTDGPHTFEVRATDAAGNADPTPASQAFTVDTGAPSTTIDSGPSGPTTDSAPTYTFTSDEPGSTFECRVDAGAWASCTSPSTVGPLADGPHTFEVRATDPAGNQGPPSGRQFEVDTAAPETTIDSGPSGPTGDPTPTYAFSSSEPGSTLECRVDGGAWATCTSPETTASLNDGPHTFEVRATDAAGNVDPTPALRTINVDSAAPETTIVSGPAGTVNDSTPTFAFDSSEPGSYECRVDGGAWVACTSPFTTATLTDGPHTFEVRALDVHGNADPTPAQRAFTVITAAPPEEPEPAGSLLGAATCQQMAPGPRSMKRRVPGVGRVTVKMATEGTIVATSPLMVTTRAPRARTRAVRYFLDNRRLRGTNRRLGWAQAITPALLANSSTHTLTIAVAGRGGRKRFALRFATLRCDAVFTASQKNKGRYSELALRVDTRTPARSIVYTVPRRLVPRARPNTVAGSLLVQTSAGGAQTYPLSFSSGGVLAGAASGARVAIAGGQLSVTDLPAGTKIATLTLKRNRTKSARAASRKPIRLRASVTADVSYLLAARLRGKR